MIDTWDHVMMGSTLNICYHHIVYMLLLNALLAEMVSATLHLYRKYYYKHGMLICNTIIF